jgi:E3 ubiquitin-protein ligase TRIP12
MSSNTPGSSSNKSQTTQESSIASSSTATSHHNLRKRPALNVPVTKEAATSSTPTISGHPATSHSKLRKTSNNVTGSKPDGVRSLDLPSSSNAKSSGHIAGGGDTKAVNDNSAASAPVTASAASQPPSSSSAAKSTKTSVPKLKYEIKNLTDHFPDQVSNDGRLTRSRTRALAAFVPGKQPSTSSRPSTSTKSFFAQGKDKIAKRGRDLLKNTEHETKKERSSRSEKRDGSSGNDGASPNSDTVVVVRNSESPSSPDTPEPSIGGSARTTPFSLQQTNSNFAPRRFTALNPSAVSGQPQIPTSSGLPMTSRMGPRGTSFLSSLVPRMQHLLGGNGSGMLGHSVNLMPSNGRYSSLMEGLRSSNEIRQSEAANELAELLLMGNEESLPNLPIREVVQLLNTLMQKENNLALTLTAVRCITNMQEALPRAMPVLAETVPTLLQKLKHIECIDIAEQTLVALEVLSRRNAKSIIHAGGFSDAVMHVDFFSMPSQRLVYQIAANCASHITQQDFGLLKSCMLDLVQKLTFDDKRCCESICTFFYRLIENFRNSPDRLRDIAGKNYEFLSKVQQLFMIQPSTINSDTFVNLLKSVRFMCIKCSDVVSALINMEFGRTLRFLLIGTERADASVDITLRPPQHMREIISLISELLPPLPKIDIFEISSAVLQYMSNSIPAALALGGGNGTSLHGGIGDETEMDSAVSVTWQYEEEMGNMIDFSAEMTALLEAKRAAGVTETVVFISNTPCEANLIEMKYSNHQTGFLGRIDRRITATAIEQQEEEAERDIKREKHNKRLVDLIRILFPILVEIGSATSCSNLRFEATRAMIRMMYAVESETQLKAILHNLPLASYIASTLSSNKGHSVTVSALQLVHVILDKLPRLYVPLFESEGVFFMIKKLIKDEIKIQSETPSSSSSVPSTAAAATSTVPPSSTTTTAPQQQIQTKVINLRRGPIEVPTPNTPSSVVQPPPPATSSTVSAAPTIVGAASIEGNFSDNSSVSSLSSINSNGSNAASQGSIPGSITSASTAASVHTFNRIAQSMLIQDESLLTARHLAVLSSSNYHSLVYPQLMQQGHLLQMNHQGSGGNSSILQNINQELSLAMQQANAAAAGSNGISIATAYKQALADRITNWVSKEAKHIISTYHENENLYESDQTIVKELNRIALLFEKNNCDTGYEGLEALKALMKVNDISAFQLNHSNVIRNLAKYLADNSEERKPNREIRLKRFIETFMNMTENNLRPMNLNGDLYAPFERLVTKIVHAVGQLEQFHIKITNLSGILTESSGGSSSANNISTVLRGSNALRFFQTHQIRCNLRRHPSCKQLREWRHGRGSIKVDPFTSVSAIERYLVDRGIGNNASATAASDSSSDNEDGSEDDPDVASSNDSNSPSTAPFTGKIEILIGDTPVPSDLSILQAIRQFSLPHDDDQEVIPPSIWITAHTLYFRIASSSSDETGGNDGSGEAGSSSSTAAGTKKRKSGSKKPRSKSCKPLVFSTGKAPSRKNPIDAFLQLNLETQFVDPCYDSCVLLRILYGLNKYWWTLFEEKWPITHEAILPSSIFLSSKMNSKVQRQLSDFLSVATQQVPKWTTNIVHAVPFIFSFSVRRNLLYCTSFGRDRALMHLVTEGNDDHEGESTNRLIPRLERRKVTVKRNNLLADAISTFHQMGSSKAQLEVNFEGEVGTGFGPTLEFYSTISREIQKHSLGLWSGVSQPFSFGEDGDSEDFTIGPNGLYPISINRAIKTKADGRTKRFEFIGRLLAQALLDSRMLDIPFSPIFFKWLLNEEDTIGAFDMEMVDKTFYNSIRSIILTEDAKDLESLELYFTMPGDETFELIKSGKSTQVNKENVQQYVDLVLHWLLVEGVRDDMLSLRKGFEQVVDPNVLKIFCCEEMEELFCGCCEGSPENDRIWSKSALQQALRPDHGYTHESPQIQWLVDMIHSFSLQDRRNFLQFCTGSPRLPVGGFRSLNPPLTVVRKTVAYGNVEGELPSAMTCYNFLKIPPYASYETFIERFRLALQYIYSFHLT